MKTVKRHRRNDDHDLIIEIGHTFTIKVQIMGSLEDGDHVDITAHELTLTVKSSRSASNADATYMRTDTIPRNTETIGGRWNFTLETAETALLPPGRFIYALDHTIPGAPPVIQTLFEGSLTIRHPVRRHEVQ